MARYTFPTEGVVWPPRLVELHAFMRNHGLPEKEWDEYRQLLEQHDPEALRRRSLLDEKTLFQGEWWDKGNELPT